jgi:hypothetical protein
VCERRQLTYANHRHTKQAVNPDRLIFRNANGWQRVTTARIDSGQRTRLAVSQAGMC